MFLRKELIRVHQSYASQEEALRGVAQGFVDEGLCKDSFPQAIVDREKVYPTGLRAVLDIAIPHCAASNVNETSMAVVTLDSPVTWHEMGDPTNTLEPKVLFMLAIQDPDKQLETLQKIMAIIQDKELLTGIVKADTADEVYELLKDKVGE